MSQPIVSIVTYTEPVESLRSAVEKAEGFSKLKSGDRVVIKPNALTWDNDHKIPPYGVFTTTRMVQDMVTLLKQFGVTDITIGEGSVQIYKDSPGSLEVMKNLGYEEIARKEGVKLADFNTGEFTKVEVADGVSLHFAKEAMEADFLIDIPAMKTHSQTKVSLGFKNLKGTLKTVSKRTCHHKDLDLDYFVSLVGETVAPALTIIDGIYVLEKGPIHTGNAYRANTIVASTDMLAADITATVLMGLDPHDIGHLAAFAERNGRSLDTADFDIRGESIEIKKTPVKWDWNWNADNTGPTIFDRMGISGVAVPKYDSTLCTGCSPVVNMANIFIISGHKGEPFSNFEVLSGKRMQARPGYDKTILIGNCIIKANKDNPNIKEAVKIPGCPPKVSDLKSALSDCGVQYVEGAYDYYLNQLSGKYDGKEGFEPSFYIAG
ncbi:MAG: DUF362 domain-containing protein [Deltaproteobacteria bacterium]|nr:DUF362 domain-containing protein [Candidatus Zymogenaceae bacterium]